MDQTKLLSAIQGNQEVLMALLKQTKAISGTPDAQLVYGTGGFFANCGLDRTVINASMSPTGMDAMIPVFGTQFLNPIFPYLTGFEDDGSAEPAGVCDDAPGGVIEVCHQTAAFGRYTRSSKEIEANELMQIVNGNVTTDLQVLGSVLGQGHSLLSSMTQEAGGWINRVVQVQMVIVGVLLQRLLCRQLWQGDPANNNAGGGYREFPGLDILISTGKVDAYSGVACGALDSDVKDFNYGEIDGADPDIVAWISMLCQYLENNSRGMGLEPVTWVLAMRPQLFWELTAIWPCRYLTDRCSDLASTQVTQLVGDNSVRMRDEMRNGRFLTVNGRRYPVALDDGIFEDTPTTTAELNPGEFASDLYVVPLTARNIPVLYWEHLDYSKISSQDLAVLNNKQRFFSSDGGRYMWAVQDLNWCFKLQGKLEPRVVLRTPQLAGRLQHIKYSPLQHLREPFADSPYFKKGGKEDSTPESFYTDWGYGHSPWTP